MPGLGISTIRSDIKKPFNDEIKHQTTEVPRTQSRFRVRPAFEIGIVLQVRADKKIEGSYGL